MITVHRYEIPPCFTPTRSLIGQKIVTGEIIGYKLPHKGKPGYLLIRGRTDSHSRN